MDRAELGEGGLEGRDQGRKELVEHRMVVFGRDTR